MASYGLAQGWRTIDQNTRLALWDIHRNFVPAIRASKIKETQLDAAPITFKRDQTTLVLHETFRNGALCWWERFKLDVMHHLEVEGVVVMTYLRTRDGSVVPKTVPPETYVLQVRHRILGEAPQFRALRVSSNRHRADENRERSVLDLPAMRLDAGIAYPDPGEEDPLLVVLSGFGSDPSDYGQLNSVVASFYEEWLQYKTAVSMQTETHHQQLFPRHFVEMGEMSEGQVKGSMFGRYAADGTKAVRQHEDDEARNASIAARNEMNRRMLALNSRDAGGTPASGPLADAGITENDPGVLGYAARMLNRNHLTALPPNASLANEYRVFPNVDVDGVYARVSKTVTEAYGVPSGYFDMAANMKGNDVLYERVMASTTNATARKVSAVLTEAYNFLHGASICTNELFRIYEEVLRPELQKQLREIVEEKIEAEEDATDGPVVQKPNERGRPPANAVASMRDVFPSVSAADSEAFAAWELATQTDFDQKTVDQQILEYIEAEIEGSVRHFAGMMPARKRWASDALESAKRHARATRITLEVAGFSRTEPLEDSVKRFMYYGSSTAELLAAMRQSGGLDESDSMSEEERAEAVAQLAKARKKYFMDFVAADLGIQKDPPLQAGDKRPSSSSGSSSSSEPAKKKPKQDDAEEKKKKTDTKKKSDGDDKKKKDADKEEDDAEAKKKKKKKKDAEQKK